VPVTAFHLGENYYLPGDLEAQTHGYRLEKGLWVKAREEKPVTAGYTPQAGAQRRTGFRKGTLSSSFLVAPAFLAFPYCQAEGASISSHRRNDAKAGRGAVGR
jgi:hypothetical protein